MHYYYIADLDTMTYLVDAEADSWTNDIGEATLYHDAMVPIIMSAAAMAGHHNTIRVVQQC